MICIIPARKGSKRIPRKNVKEFFGKPMIAYPITTAIESGCFEKVIVSTDCDTIASIAKEYGADIMMRSEKNSTDTATTFDAIKEVVKNLDCKDICVIYPCNPLFNEHVLINAKGMFYHNRLDAVWAVVKYSHPISRAMFLDKHGAGRFVNDKKRNTRTQDCVNYYHDAGMFYLVNVDAMLKEKTLMCKNNMVLVVNKLIEADIDDINDWNFAEVKYKHLRGE